MTQTLEKIIVPRQITRRMADIEARYHGVPIRDLLIAGLRRYGLRPDPHSALADEWRVDRATIYRWAQRLGVVVVFDRDGVAASQKVGEIGPGFRVSSDHRKSDIN